MLSRWGRLLALPAIILAFAAPAGAMLMPAGGGVAKPHVQPPPPPPPPAPVESHSPWVNPPWKGLGIHVAWGFETGQWTPDQLAQILATNHFNWACLEGSPAAYNEQFMAAFRDALHARGLKFCIWERADRQKSYPESYIDHAKRMIDTYHPDWYAADAEAFPLEDPNFPAELAAAFPNLPKVWEPAGLPDATETQIFVNAGFDVMAEDYAANVGHDPVDGIACAVDHDAYWRGVPRVDIAPPAHWGAKWCEHGSGPHTWPIIEVHAEGNPDLKTQLPAVAPWGRNFSIWNAEQMTDEDWAVARSLDSQP